MFRRKAKAPARQRSEGGGQSAPVYSYYNSPVPSDKAVDLSLPRGRARLLPTFLALGVIVFSLIFNLTLSTSLSIKTTDGQPSPYRSAEAYQIEMEKMLSSSLNSKTKLTINISELESQMLAYFPEMKNIALRLPILGRRLNVTIELRRPALILTSPGTSFVIDDSGRAVSLLKDISDEALTGLPVVKDESGLDLKVGDQAITSQTVEFINAMFGQLDSQNLKVTQLTLPLAANQLDIRLEGVNYYLKTDVSGDARLQIGRYLAVKERLGREGVTPAEYVDVRVEEKVFYK